jgi:hypothetical protein
VLITSANPTLILREGSAGRFAARLDALAGIVPVMSKERTTIIVYAV